MPPFPTRARPCPRESLPLTASPPACRPPDYFPIGLVGYRVDINWPTGNGPTCQTLPLPTAKQDAELMLHNLNQQYLLVNLAAQGAGSFFDPATFYGFDLDGSSGVLGEQFKALIFLDHSKAMSSLRWPDCP